MATRLFISALVGALLVGAFTAPAAAGGRVGFHYGVGYGGGFYDRGPFWRPHWRVGANYGFRRGYRHGYWRGHRGAGGGDVAAAAILGLGTGYLLSEAIRRDRRYDSRYYDPVRVRTDRYVTQDVHRWAPPPARRETEESPRDRPAWAPNSFPNEACLVVREYQTTIIIDGQEKPAYGPACLKPDGTWLQGSARVAPNGG